MADPFTLAAVIGGVSMAASAASAANQNAQIRKQAGTARKLENYNQAQRDIALTDANVKIGKSLHRFLGAISAGAAERGVGFGGSTYASEISSRLQAVEDSTNAKFNTDNANTSGQLQTDQRIQDLYSKIQNPVFAGITGGLGGFTTGLSISNGLRELNAP